MGDEHNLSGDFRHSQINIRSRFGEMLSATSPAYAPPPLPDRNTIPEPGTLPPGSRMPYARNALFTGRMEPLQELASQLLYDSAQFPVVSQAIFGMGGVGKTQLAVEFAYRYGKYLHGVHWLNAAQPDALDAEVAACGVEMCLPGWPEKQAEQVARTLQVWSHHGPRLVIMDNLEDIAAAGPWMARLSRGTGKPAARLLVTTRSPTLPRTIGVTPLHLKTFTPKESRAFLRRYISTQRAADHELDRLAEQLGRLPLALELAGRYMDAHERLTVADYSKRIAEVLSHPSMQGWQAELGNPTGHELDLARTFAVSWERVASKAARRVFMMIGYCAPDVTIPSGLIEKAAGFDAEACDEAMVELAGLGLVERRKDASGPSIHSLLAEFGRSIEKAVGEEARTDAVTALAGALARLADEALGTGLPEVFGPLHPHLEVVAQAAEDAGLASAGQLWHYLGRHLLDVADYDKAQVALEHAVRVDEQIYGAEHPAVGRDANTLGLVQHYRGELLSAQAELERALRIFEQAYGPEDPNVAKVVNNLGGVLQVSGDLAEARAAYERAIRIDEQVYGPEHPIVATDVSNLGTVLLDLGDLAGARAACERAMQINEQHFGLEQRGDSTVIHNLGVVLHAQGELDRAHVLFERAMRIDERVYGAEHPKVARDVNSLGKVLQDQGDLAGARAAFEQALRIDEQVYGPEHLKVARDVNNLGRLLQALGDLAGAQAVLERALAILLKSLPAGHPRIKALRQALKDFEDC